MTGRRYKLSDDDKKWLEETLDRKIDEAVTRGMATFAAYIKKVIKSREKAREAAVFLALKGVARTVVEKYAWHAILTLTVGAVGLIAKLKGFF